MSEFLLFLACLAFGGAIGAADRLLERARKRLHIVGVILIDILLAGLSFAAVFLTALFFGDGIISAHFAIAEIIGFAVCRFIRFKRRKNAKRKTVDGKDANAV